MKNSVFVLDTNIWISVILNQRLNRLVEFQVNENCIFLSCDNLEKEVKDVLSRPKIRKYIDKSISLEILKLFKKITQKIKLDRIGSYSSDKDDDFIFELAYVGKADAIVSGDRHVLNCKGEFPFKLVSFSEFKKTCLYL